MNGLNDAALDIRDIGVRNRSETSRPADFPLQATDPVMAGCWSRCGEYEIVRQRREHLCYRLGDRFMSPRRMLKFMELHIFMVDFADRCDTQCGITLAEDQI